MSQSAQYTEAQRSAARASLEAWVQDCEDTFAAMVAEGRTCGECFSSDDCCTDCWESLEIRMC